MGRKKQGKACSATAACVVLPFSGIQREAGFGEVHHDKICPLLTATCPEVPSLAFWGLFCVVAHLDSAQKHSREEERHQGCSKIPDDEPGCNIQHQDVAEIEDEKGVVGLEKPHPLHGGTELTEILHQLFLWGDPKASTGQKTPQEHQWEHSFTSQG